MEIRKLVEIEQVVGITCDICNKNCQNDPIYTAEYATLHASWGYGSSRDGDQDQCDICESCYDKVIAFIKSIGGNIRTKNIFRKLD